MDYFRLTAWPLKADPEWMERALDEIGADSPLWCWQMADPWGFPNRVGQAIGQTPNPEKYEGYWLQILENLPEDRWTGVGYAVSFEVMQQFEESPTPETEGLAYLGLDKDSIAQEAMARFPDHGWVKNRVKGYFDQLEMVGQQVPDFSVPSLEDPDVFYTSKNIQADVYLLDFWATWCGPCIEQFPHLHRLYDEFSPKGFEILGYSWEDNIEIVQDFREKSWPLPWLNAIEPGKGPESEISKAFEVEKLPKTFLVKKDGEILAIDPNDEQLEGLLRQHLLAD
jgi:thiol-disulfide isomerase/thioredoxin